MDATLNFEKLVDNLTEQHRQKSSLEVAIKRCDAEKKSHEGALSAARYKEESLQKQIPDIKKEIGKQNALCGSMQAELEQQKNSSNTLRSNVARMKAQVTELQELINKEESENTNFLRNTEEKYAMQIQKLQEIWGKN